MKIDKKKTCVSAAVSLVLLVGCYLYWNLPASLGYGNAAIRKISVFNDQALKQERRSFDDVVAVNTSYDRTLVPYDKKIRIAGNEYEVPVGSVDITDRSKLLSLLEGLKKWDNYKYIVLDVNFDNGIRTPYDSALFSTIASMRDIVVAGNPDICPPEIKAKVADDSYIQSKRGEGFFKYTYLREGKESMALRMWREIDGGDITHCGPLYFSGGDLCIRSVVPDLPYIIDDDYDRGEETVYNLGVDILDEGKFEKLFNGRIVLAGDFFEYDYHESIRNRVAGSAIIYNAYLALCSGAHLVPLWVGVVLFFSFALLFYLSLSVVFWNKPKNWVWLVLKIILFALGYSVLLAIVCAVLYRITGVYYNIIGVGWLIGNIQSILQILKEWPKIAKKQQ